ncbi:MAG: sensor histidine kinase [Spirochaetales bacterium]|nr:sensor histidine kinase [Spirochaetales bacterium]
MRQRIQPLLNFFQKRLFSTSLRQTLKFSYFIIICLMMIPPTISLASSWFQTVRYDRMITNVSRTNRLNQIIKSDISNEIWDIVAGNKNFDEGTQYEIIDDINGRLEEIFESTEVRENRRLLEVAGRAMDTLTGYVDMLGTQIENNFLVTRNEEILDEIRGVADLISDLLQDFIVLEIESAAATNEQIKRVALFLTLLQIIILLIVLIFALQTQRTVVQSINGPISELVTLSHEIAAGNLEARAERPHVRELDNLTDNLNIMAAKIRELIDENIREQKNLQKSEMKALQAQITPHFLYNTLDTIVWLAEGKQYDQVISVTRNFSSFFRTALNRGKDWICVAEELEHVRNYLSIQKVRYRDILDFTLDFDPAMTERIMLKLLLQPLVENALYHGIKNKRGRGMIKVTGWTEGGRLCFRVEDNGIGMTPERLADVKRQMEEDHDRSHSGDIYGLYNVNKRLSLYYNGQTELTIESTYREGTTVSFRVPETEYV